MNIVEAVSLSSLGSWKIFMSDRPGSLQTIRPGLCFWIHR